VDREEDGDECIESFVVVFWVLALVAGLVAAALAQLAKLLGFPSA
jgi:hypothetical protein